MSNRINKFHIFTKTLTQIFLVIIEISFVGVLVAFICNEISPTSNFIEHTSRFLIGSSIYELIVFCTLTQINDARKDALLALRTSFRLAEMYCNNGSTQLKTYIKDTINKQLDGKRFNHIDIRKNYSELLNHIESKKVDWIQTELILIEHYYESESLQWRYSIILRLIKEAN